MCRCNYKVHHMAIFFFSFTGQQFAIFFLGKASIGKLGKKDRFLRNWRFLPGYRLVRDRDDHDDANVNDVCPSLLRSIWTTIKVTSKGQKNECDVRSACLLFTDLHLYTGCFAANKFSRNNAG